MTKMQELAEMIRDLPIEETCPLCHGEGFIDCPDHGAELDHLGSCAICEAPMDGLPAHQVTCPCNWD